ncbi:hypothetical protein QBC35DRAFT_535618 [Podospora australis]|uniref:Uncharacterized protein n=1 Tax=Podospora australis TaxID=1536484 RepID=A0AAN6WLQ8_9PEZI|nr:hypothetical protein QBC35DRAFT_535618 [Podospora australis]
MVIPMLDNCCDKYLGEEQVDQGDYLCELQGNRLQQPSRGRLTPFRARASNHNFLFYADIQATGDVLSRRRTALPSHYAKPDEPWQAEVARWPSYKAKVVRETRTMISMRQAGSGTSLSGTGSSSHVLVLSCVCETCQHGVWEYRNGNSVSRDCAVRPRTLRLAARQASNYRCAVGSSQKIFSAECPRMEAGRVALTVVFGIGGSGLRSLELMDWNWQSGN